MPQRAPVAWGQFAIGRDDLGAAPREWPRYGHGGWTLAAHPTLPVVRLVDSRGGPCGWLVGRAFDGSRPPADPLTLPTGAGADAAEDVLYRMAGRWVALVDLGAGPRVYLDATGSMGAVYGLKDTVVAATPWLILGARYDDDLDTRLVDDVEANAPAFGPTYYGGLTAHRSVRRLLPNHYLDLDAWVTRRHWPRAPIVATGDITSSVTTIVSSVRDCVAAAVSLGEIHLSLTAGYDSRMVLACARPHLERARLFTTTRQRGDVDASVARVMRRRLGLEAEVIPLVTASDADIEAWKVETGHCIGGAIARIHPTLRRLDPRRLTLPGLCGEVGRCTSFVDGDEERRPHALELLRRWGIGTTPRFVEAIDAWLDELTDQTPAAVRDLFHIEQQLGCWVGPQQYGTVAYSDVVLPLSGRTIIDTMIRLPVAYRRRQELALDIYRTCWPELLDFPVNRYAGMEAVRERWLGHGRAMPATTARKARGALRRGRRLARRVTGLR